jgi:hypothetical protein
MSSLLYFILLHVNVDKIKPKGLDSFIILNTITQSKKWSLGLGFKEEKFFWKETVCGVCGKDFGFLVVSLGLLCREWREAF